jgi:hypothetical protein
MDVDGRFSNRRSFPLTTRMGMAGALQRVSYRSWHPQLLRAWLLRRRILHFAAMEDKMDSQLHAVRHGPSANRIWPALVIAKPFAVF